MSLSNDNQLLDLVAFAARFPKETRHWDPKIAILDELNDIVTCAESDKRIDPTDELPTKDSLTARLKHLDNIESRASLKTLDVKDACSPSDDLDLVKHYLTRLKHEYKKRRKESASAEFLFHENCPESDMKIVGVWIAARVCFEWGYAYPGHQRYPLHSIAAFLSMANSATVTLTIFRNGIELDLGSEMHRCPADDALLTAIRDALVDKLALILVDPPAHSFIPMPSTVEMMPVRPNAQLRFVSRGATSWVYQVDEDLILKIARDQATNAFQHENMIYDELEQHEPSPYLLQSIVRLPLLNFLPIMGRGSLEQRIKNNQRRGSDGKIHVLYAIPQVQAEQWAMEIAGAVAWLESIGYVHGDLRPANMLIDDTNHIKLADFDSVFEARPLMSEVNWDEVQGNVVTVIAGRGQKVLWTGANVTVITKDSQGAEQRQPLWRMHEGEGILEEGSTLYITEGKVLEP
ncbi:hypothetical protein O9K51_11253 [Purpureocillium lavendulum]|uniref:EKC/KEOPS complex subunit BUD32 n=1 Tax=Purpureocillium lavendulum TaxID=1247861 RepID=A0AB34FBX0_9HYPO|nr:hypothetical protein O9K51_11253 [Purpureocillium lavendulum]